MNRTTLAAVLLTGSALVGANYLMRRRTRPQALPSQVIPIITPVIDMGIAEDVLEAMAQLDGGEVTLVLHTSGGCVASCVLIANALREFRVSRAIVPYMAMSGGTLIALNADVLEMGASASLSAVDPVIGGIRARHLQADDKDPSLKALASEYATAIGKYLHETIKARLEYADEDAIERAYDVFIGEHAPHEWPIRRPEVAALGFPVGPAKRSWGMMVDAYRKRWW
jgi:membrane-bound ClpP family serine protease